METRLAFRTKEEFNQWLLNNHDKCDEFWVVFSKTPEIETIKYDEAIEVATCYGWVDIILKRINALTYMRKYKRRNPRGTWSEKNKKLAEKLLDEGKMHESGIKVIEAAIQSGAWDKNTTFEISQEQKKEFDKLLQPFEKARLYFSSLPPSHQRQYLAYYYYPKKEETRAKHLVKIIELLEKKKGFM